MSPRRTLIGVQILLILGSALTFDLGIWPRHKLSLGQRLKREGKMEEEDKESVGFKGFSSEKDVKVPEGHQGQGLNMVEFFKEKRKTGGQSEMDFGLGDVHRNEMDKLLEKLLAFSPDPLLFFSNSNQQPKHFFSSFPKISGRLSGQTLEQQNTDSFYHFLKSIVEHPGKISPEQDDSPISIFANRIAFDPKEKRTANSGYICHFKLCQFGSSGKRVYKPQSRNTFEHT